MKINYRICLVGMLLILTTGCDQLSKKVAQAELVSSAPISSLKGLVRFEYTENPGAFLSLGEHLPRPALLLLSSLVFSFLMFLLVRLSIRKRTTKLITLIGMSLLAGGSLGNIVDRITNNGAVVDFMSVGIGGVRSGIFNFADIAILLGVFMLITAISRTEEKMTTAGRAV